MVNTKLDNQTYQLRALKLDKDEPEYNSINISEKAKQILQP